MRATKGILPPRLPQTEQYRLSLQNTRAELTLYAFISFAWLRAKSIPAKRTFEPTNLNVSGSHRVSWSIVAIVHLGRVINISSVKGQICWLIGHTCYLFPLRALSAAAFFAGHSCDIRGNIYWYLYQLYFLMISKFITSVRVNSLVRCWD